MINEFVQAERYKLYLRVSTVYRQSSDFFLYEWTVVIMI